jgi:hypothetical protein
LEEAEDTHLSDLVVVGYSKVERRDLTGSVSSVKPLDEKPYLSLDQMLAGQAPGVFVSNSSGELGSANLLTIRGVSSIMGDNNPLYVIDGVPVYGTGRSSNSSVDDRRQRSAPSTSPAPRQAEDPSTTTPTSSTTSSRRTRWHPSIPTTSSPSRF